MNVAESLLRHLFDLDVDVHLKPDFSGLDLDASQGVLTPELLELLREHRDDLIQTLFEREEGEAIQWEGRLSSPYVKYTGDERLVQAYRCHPSVMELTEAAMKHFGGGVMEFMNNEKASEETEETRAA
ncbi:MAG: hypothetical protein M3447_10420 [Acidobacteriota bacterium]|nr:hypothetical protein [Acidobacteriota bacterium]